MSKREKLFYYTISFMVAFGIAYLTTRLSIHLIDKRVEKATQSEIIK